MGAIVPRLERVERQQCDEPAAALRDHRRQQPREHRLNAAALRPVRRVEPYADAGESLQRVGWVGRGEVLGRDRVERAGVRVDRERIARHVVPPQPRRRLIVVLRDDALEEETRRAWLDEPTCARTRDAAV